MEMFSALQTLPFLISYVEELRWISCQKPKVYTTLQKPAGNLVRVFKKIALCFANLIRKKSIFLGQKPYFVTH